VTEAAKRPLPVLDRILGDRIESGFRPFMAMLLLAVAAQYAFLSLFPIWAVSRLDVADSSVGLGLSVAGVLAALSAPLGGRISDRVGRGRVIAGGLVATTVAPLALVGPTPGPVLGLGAFGLYSVGIATRWTAQQALVGDLVGPQGRERAFAATRTAYNVGASAGPPLGAALVLLDFQVAFAAAAALSMASLLLVRNVPDPAPAKRPAGGPGAWRTLRAPAIALVIGASLLGWCVYQGFELLLPISLTQSHGYTPSAWGLFFVINPVLVAVLQVRLVRWTAAVPRHVKLALACLLMGGCFLLVPAGATVVLVVAVVVLFAFGEMLFGPSNQALLADISPSHARGAAMGLLSSTTSLSVAMTPGLGLAVRAAWGDAAMWVAVAATSTVAAALYFWPVRRFARRIAVTP